MSDPSVILIHSNQSTPEGYFCSNPSLFISQPAKAPNNDLSHTSRSSSQVLVHASRMSREIVHVKLPLSMLKEKTVTPEQNRDFLKRFEEHKMYCIECHGKKLIETALSHPQSARLEEHPFPQDNLRSSRT